MCPVCGAGSSAFEPVEETPHAAPAGSSLCVVVVGAGIAGVSAAEAVARAAPGAQVLLLSSEKELPYYRINLTRFLAGEVTEGDLRLHPEGWYGEHGIELRRGTEAAGIDLAGRLLTLRDGSKVPFTRLVLAAGAHAARPPIPGADKPGVVVLRTLEDAHRVSAACRQGARCVVVGGGILGLETAGAMARKGAEVHVLEGFPWLMPRQLNQRAGRLLEAQVAKLGVKVITAAKTRGITGTGQADGVELDSGQNLPAELVVLATGVRANTWLAREAGLTVAQGIVVDNRLATSHADVYAAGDVAEHRGVAYGLWAPAQAQGVVAGMNAAGSRAEFGGIPRAATIKVLGVELFSVGRFDPEDGATLVVEEEQGETYRRFLFRDGKMQGAVLLGSARLAAAAKRAVEEGRDFSAMLHHGPSAEEVAQALGG
jgi:nitrite reductase (NADH) large subunit